jgi:hypothetical protein
MKFLKYITGTLALGTLVFTTSCTNESGTEPGNDKSPVVTLYQYAPTGDEYDSDVDVQVRFATNGATQEVYYYVENADDAASYIATNGADAYTDKVISQGTKVEGIDGASNVDVIITNLAGTNKITAVAVNGSSRYTTSTEFTADSWTTLAEGTYTFGNSNIAYLFGATTASTKLQQNDANENLYRFKDLYGKGSHLKMTYSGISEYDETYGVNQMYMRVAAQATALSHSSYGTINVRDIATWQSDDSYVTAMPFVLYSDYYAEGYLQYYVSAGSFGYKVDEFAPAE